MTSLQVSVLWRAAQDHGHMRGTAELFEHQAGRTRQVRWLLARKLIRFDGGRLVATRDGRKVLDYQKS